MILNKNNSLTALLTVVVVFCFISPISLAKDYEKVTVTNKQDFNYRAHFHNGIISWINKDKSGESNDRLQQIDITAKDSEITTAFTFPNNISTLMSSYDGKVAWADNVDKTLLLWDKKNTTEIAKKAVRPSLSNGKLVYESYLTAGHDIYLQSGLSLTKITNQDFNDITPVHFNGKTAWVGERTANYQVYLADENGSVAQISSDSGEHGKVSLYANSIAWRGKVLGGGDTDYEIYFYNGSDIIRVTNNQVEDDIPSLFDGKIAWLQVDGDNYNVMYWDGEDIIEVVSNTNRKEVVTLYNGIIAWSESLPEDSALVYYTIVGKPELATISTDVAADITSHSAKLNARIHVNQKHTSYYFQYGTTSNHGLQTTRVSLPASKKELSVATTISGLTPNQRYYYRIVAENDSGVSYGANYQFTTQPFKGLVLTREINDNPVAVTDNRFSSQLPQIHNGIISWVYKAGLDEHYKLYQKDLYDADSLTTIQFSFSDTFRPLGPRLSSYDGMVAWADEGTINYWDGSNINELANGDYPSLGKNKILYHHPVEALENLYLKSTLGVAKIEHPGFNNVSPTYFNGTMAWLAYAQDATVPQVFYSDSNGSITQITSNTQHKSKPSIYENMIAWSANSIDADFNDQEIYYYNGSNIIRLTDNHTNDDYPAVFNGTIAWIQEDGYDIDTNDKSIMYWNGLDIRKIHTSTKVMTDISLYNGIVVWRELIDNRYYQVFYAVVDRSLAPIVSNDIAENITAQSVTLNARVDFNQHMGSYYFEYGGTSEYGEQTETVNMVASNHAQSVSEILVGLKHNTRYHYRIVGINENGTSRGVDYQFTTASLPSEVPTILIPEITDVSYNSANVKVSINPNGLDTQYWLLYGTSEATVIETLKTDIGNQTTPQTFDATLSNLEEYTTYFCVLYASNSAGEVHDLGEVTFKTAAQYTLPVPSVAGELIDYDAPRKAGVSDVFSQFKPIGIEHENNQLNLNIALPLFDGPVDVVLAISAPAIDPNNLYLITEGPDFQVFVDQFTSWKSNVTAPFNVNLFDASIDTSDLPSGRYSFFIAITPHNDLSAYHLWKTDLVIP